MAITNVDKIREQFALSGNESDAESLLLAQKHLENIRAPKIQGLIIRSRVRWHEEGEKCSKYFLSLERANGKRKSIQTLQENGKLVTNKKKIISMFSKQLSERYTADYSVTSSGVSKFLERNVKSKLSEEQKRKLEEPITMSELSTAIMTMKVGKSPGSNGFTASFFKHFWDHLGIFLFRTVNQSLTDGSFPQTHREAIITMIPKAGKALDTCRGWRPISLLNVDFKIVSAAITNRLKTVMNDVISPSQSAYIKGRSIVENSRLVYDVIQKVNDEERTGYIMAADFEAAFESISWDFLLKTLDCCNFGPNFRYLLQLAYLNRSNFARILIDGFLGENVYMQRGIRQGDPASGYLFNLAVEPLANLIKQCKEIRGITLCSEVEVRLSQYADDLILFLNEPEAITRAIVEIEKFSSVSGLKLNIDKTKCLPIGNHLNRSQGNLPRLQYVDELKILGISYGPSNESIFRTNLMHRLPLVEKEISQWKRRHITLIGKVTVVKSLLISQLVHLFLSLPTPSKKDIEQIETKLFFFIWGDKNDKVKRTKVVQGLNNDGLSMIDVNSFIKSMKVTWIKRLYSSQHDWAKLIQKELPPVPELLTYGTVALAKVKGKLTNPFWKEVISAWSDFWDSFNQDSNEVITEALWFSNVTKYKNSKIKTWDNAGLRFIADLINNDTGTLYSKGELEIRYGIRMTFLCYSSLVRSLPNIVKESNYKSCISYPLIPFRINVVQETTSAKISQLVYKEYVSCLKKQHENSQRTLKEKWVRDIRYFHCGSMWDVSKATKNTYIQTFHFRLISRIIATNKFLQIIGKTEDNSCTFCSSEVETINHLFWGCRVVQRFTSEIDNVMNSRFGFQCNFTERKCFFPNLDECQKTQIIVCSVAKIVIYSARHHKNKPSITHFLNGLQLEATNEFHSARLSGELVKYHDKWKQLKLLPEINIEVIPHTQQHAPHVLTN